MSCASPTLYVTSPHVCLTPKSSDAEKDWRGHVRSWPHGTVAPVCV